MLLNLAPAADNSSALGELEDREVFGIEIGERPLLFLTIWALSVGFTCSFLGHKLTILIIYLITYIYLIFFNYLIF